VRVSVGPTGAEANGASRDPTIDAAGRRIAFASRASNLVAGDDDRKWDVFVCDVAEKVVTRVNQASSKEDGAATSPHLSADGRRLAFSSWAHDGAGKQRVVVRDLAWRDAQVASVDAQGVGLAGSSWRPRLSADGGALVFFTAATTGVPGIRAYGDLLVRRIDAQITHHALDGAARIPPAHTRTDGVLSADAKVLAFASAPADGRERSPRHSRSNVLVYERGLGDPQCGDFVVSSGEECDAGPGPLRPGALCRSDCRWVACGDVDANGKITALDGALALRAVLSGSRCDPRVCDVDRSGGAPTMSDALRLLGRAVGRQDRSFCPTAVP
jgi:hypothetical protein